MAGWNSKLERGQLGVRNFHPTWLPEFGIRGTCVFSENPAINLWVDVKMENVKFHYCKVINPCSHQAVHSGVWKPNCLSYNAHRNLCDMGGLSQSFILG